MPPPHTRRRGAHTAARVQQDKSSCPFLPLHHSQEFIIVANIVCLIVDLGREHHEHGILGEVVHLSPHRIRKVKTLIRFFERNDLLLVSIVEPHLAAPVNTDQDLLQCPMCVMPAHHPRHGIIHIVDTLDTKRDIVELLERDKHPALIAMRLKHIFYDLHDDPFQRNDTSA